MFTLTDILEGTQGQLDAAAGAASMAEVGFTVVATDSRGSIPGALFVALTGEHVDGHSFVLDAVGHGALGAIVRTDWRPPEALPAGVALIRVDDPLKALQRLAAWWRARHEVQVIGVTGSIGKTSTKEVIAAVLESRFSTLKSPGNLNNEIGLPLTLLQLSASHRKVVLEMGAGYELGELTMLCDIARPEIAVVTNVGPVHLSRMGTLERIALNKSELVRSLPASGTAVLNADDPRVIAMREVTSAHILTYGIEEEAELCASEIESHGLNGVHFTLVSRQEGRSWRVRLPLLGRHSVHTALAAAGAARAAGMDWVEIVPALQALGAQVRLIVVPGYNGSTLIDDSYNASPDSTVAALNLLEEMPGNRIAVLGDMLELGSYEREGHLKVARRATVAAQRLVVVGSLGRLMGEEALRVGMAPERVFFAADNEQVVDYLQRILKPGDHVLVKGSRGLHMEQIVDALRV
ncbi:MAG TPA: UDP-N-acetylmuramoyl-tripeptide--D-alanyl-D-alanine ligase [Chloroflexia bacterium]|nr:UDP-N-acetylmuramoyl-tripeptide--D-alanyl-D-alanine ligase [Chloroflexia bacterium]